MGHRGTGRAGGTGIQRCGLLREAETVPQNVDTEGKRCQGIWDEGTRCGYRGVVS